MSMEYETRRFEVGDVIFLEGDEPDGFHVLQSGRVEIVVEGPNNSQISLAYVEEGDSFGEMSIVDNTPRTATAPCVTMFFQRETLAKELKAAELITFLFRNVCRKLAEQNREFSQHSYIDLQSNTRPRADYQSHLSLEPISERTERYLGTMVNGEICYHGSKPASLPLRRGFNQINIPTRGADFGFLAYVQ
jgi:CRP-like cAMP-binding protein